MPGKTSPPLCGHHHPIDGEAESQIAGAEAPRVRPELVLFPPSVCFALSLNRLGSAKALGPVQATAAPPASAPGRGYLCIPRSSLFPGHGYRDPVLHCGVQ